MSQMTSAVNQINPALGSEGNISTFSGNQVAKAEIAARERLQKAQIEAESMMQKARLDAGAEEGEANRQAQSADYQRLNESRAQEAAADRAQQQAMFDKRTAFEKEQADKLMRLEEAKGQRKAELEARMLEIEAETFGAAEEDSLKTEAEIDAKLAEMERLKTEQAALMVQIERETRQGEGRGRALRDELQQRHKTVLELKKDALTSTEVAMNETANEALQDLPGFWQRITSAIGSAPGNAIGGGAVGLAGALAGPVIETMAPGSVGPGGLAPSPQTAAQVGSNPLFNAKAFGTAIMGKLAQTMPVIEGVDPAAAQQAVTGLVAAALDGGGSMEQLDAALTQASQFVSADWLLGVAEALKSQSGNVDRYMAAMQGAEGATPDKAERSMRKQTAAALSKVGRNIEARIKSLDLNDQSEAMSKAVDLYITSYGLTGTVDQFMEVAKEYGVDSKEQLTGLFNRMEGVLGKGQIDKLRDLQRRIETDRRQLDLGVMKSNRQVERSMTSASRKARTQQAGAVRAYGQPLRDTVYGE